LVSTTVKSRIAVAQTHPELGSISANVSEIRRISVAAVVEGAQMVVFPELATTGYGFHSLDELTSALEGGTGLSELADLSRELGIVLVAGYAEIRDGIALNKAALFDNGELRADYVKTHLWNTEKEIFQAGTALPLVVETAVGRVGLAVCYDLEFPELMRHCAVNGADIVAAPTNWPQGFEASTHFGPFNGELIRAMAGASTNRMFVAIACRTGEERGVDWVDNSCIIGPDGYPVTELFDGVGMAFADIDTSESHAKEISPRNHILNDRRTDLYWGPPS
jgi:predicted amidohydrolase